MAQLSNGQLLLTGFYGTPLTAGGITRNGLLRLNADGTADASLNPGTGPTSATSSASGIFYCLPLPNGQLLVGGSFDHFNGVAVTNLVRLNSNGSVDPSFNANLLPEDRIETITLLASGKYLIGGDQGTTTSYHGLARLNADGSLDTTFNANLSSYAEANYVLAQPDGKLLVAGRPTPTGATSYPHLVRLLPDGNPDNSFTTPTALSKNVSVYSYYGKTLDLQPDGKILVLTSSNGQIIRLNADGTLDTSFQAGVGANAWLTSFTRLASGGVLVAGGFTSFSGTLDHPVVQLTSTGAIDPAFLPSLQVLSGVTSVVRQADGKLLIGGNFTEVNGQAVRRLARLTTTGALDTSFTTTASDFDYPVGDMALQPDGRLLLLAKNSVYRLLASGTRDNSFVPPSFAQSYLTHLVLQPDGRVLVGGLFTYVNGLFSLPPLLRLLANGSQDPSFTPTDTGAGRLSELYTMSLQPNGKLLVAGSISLTAGAAPLNTVARLESTGAFDTSFANHFFTSLPGSLFNISTLAVQPDGKVLAGGAFTTVDGTATVGLTRLNANGALDTGFAAPFTSGTVNSLLLQPNGHILVGGSIRGPGVPTNLARLLPTGAPDPSFGATAVPNNRVESLLAQPDGNLVLVGFFSTIGGQISMSVARLTGTNVLYVPVPQPVADRTTVWPVPAHTTLTVAPDARAHAQALDLLDLLGRTVRHQALNDGAPATLTVEQLPTGTYLLRVHYAEGLVTRRIQVQ